MSKSRKYTPLSECKRFDALGIPREVMLKAGEAAQTFAAMRTLARNTGETFASIAVIADRACLPKRTVKRHVAKLLAVKLLKHHGRQRRRTPTYTIDPFFLNANVNAKFVMLPRWAAKMLPTWAERAVFAMVVSRDFLCEVIDDGNGGAGELDPELQGEAARQRREFSASTMSKESGLSLRTIGLAKQKLVKRKLITIEPAAYYQDDHGRIHTMADGFLLNPNFKVPNDLLDRCAKVAPIQKTTKGSDTLHQGAKVALDQRKCGPDLAQKWPGGSAKVALAVNGTIKSTLNGTLKGTAEPLVAASAAVRSEEVGIGISEEPRHEAKNRLEGIDLTQRQQSIKERFEQLLANEKAG